MNKGFQALGTMFNEAVEADHISATCDHTGYETAEQRKTETKGDKILEIGGAIFSLAATAFFFLGGVEGIQEKFNTDTGANLQRIELRQIKAA